MGWDGVPPSAFAFPYDLVAKSYHENHLIPILGLDNVGKRTLLSTILRSLPPPYSPPASPVSTSSLTKLIQALSRIARLPFGAPKPPLDEEHRITTQVITIGLYFDRATFRKKTDFVIMDLAGCRKTWMAEQLLCRDAVGVIWVLDAADRGRMPEAREELTRMLRGLKTSKAPLLVLCNPILTCKHKDSSKKPLCHQDVLELDEVYEQLNRPEIVGNREWKCFEVNAQTGQGVREALEWFQDRCREVCPEITLPVLRDRTIQLESRKSWL